RKPAAGSLQHPAERGAGDAGRRPHRGAGARDGRWTDRAHDPRQRARHPGTLPAAFVRADLHDQAFGRGHRPRPRDQLRDRAGARRDDPRLQPPPRRRMLRSESSIGAPAMILLIDDDPGLAEVIELLLVREGYAVTRAGTVKAGLESMRGAEIDLVITDLKLPDGTGLNVIAAIRAAR